MVKMAEAGSGEAPVKQFESLVLSDQAGHEKLRQFLNKPMKIELSDGRTIVGAFLCTDNSPNIILGGAREYWLDAETGKLKGGEDCRQIGLTMVPNSHIQKIYVLTKEETVDTATV